jgi:haloacid dehalogenase superfamily, subfamily IA, variant 3 with third motif having DD or ED/haloacid dehalogenase superfamily, subfamily IA, variant 1 with third motif having Dx(3-4)D or Dx(3-4)E
MRYKIISLDIFQTLADVNKRIPDIWRGILKNEYTEEKAMQGAKAALGILPGVYENAVRSEQFRTMEQVYLECADKAVKKLSFAVSPQELAYHLMFQHSKAPFYPEVPGCIEKLRAAYRIILSSDSNHLMVDDLINKIYYDKAFISDDLKSYKGDKNGKFFRGVLDRLDVSPEEILHIGDSTADVLGARRAGIASCWINRNARQWSGAVQPDFIIERLSDLENIL